MVPVGESWAVGGQRSTMNPVIGASSGEADPGDAIEGARS